MSLTAALLGVSSTADALYQCEHLYTVPHQKPGGAGVTQKTRGQRGTLDGAISQWGCYGYQGVGSPLFSGCVIWRSKDRHQIEIFLSIKLLAILTWQNHQSINKQKLDHFL
jgi:hypothetical protein